MRVELWYGNFKRLEHPVELYSQVQEKINIFRLIARHEGYELNSWIYLVVESCPIKGVFLPQDQAAKWYGYILTHPKEEDDDADTL
jgi:hypothetical protein